jgi:hypothetical protein
VAAVEHALAVRIGDQALDSREAFRVALDAPADP